MKPIILCVLVLTLIGCKNEKDFKEKGFQVELETEVDTVNNPNAIQKDSLEFKTKSVGVLLTANKNIRISPLYKVNYSKKHKKRFTGSNDFHYGYYYSTQTKGNYWEGLFPGFEALYGYNMVNIYHFDHRTNSGKRIFEKPVLIKTCYYPKASVDTLNFNLVNRNFYMISVYDEDTNKDKYINTKDLRRFYWFDENGENKEAIIPQNYSVTGAKYDSANDYLYINASQDVNNNGKIDKQEPFSVFYVDLKNPTNRGLFYENN